jgi:hypothetical protein
MEKLNLLVSFLAYFRTHKVSTNLNKNVSHQQTSPETARKPHGFEHLADQNQDLLCGCLPSGYLT